MHHLWGDRYEIDKYKVKMMECNTCQEQMSLWIDDRLSQQEIQQIEAHTASCPSCRAVYDALRHVDWMLISAPMMSPMSGFTTRFQARLTTRRRRHRTWAGLTILMLASVALSISVVILLGISGLAIWESLSASGVLTPSVGLILDLGETVVASLNLAWLVAGALARGLRHPAFIAYVAATAIMVTVWTQIVTRRVLAHRPAIG